MSSPHEIRTAPEVQTGPPSGIMHRTFLDDELQDCFSQLGFVVIPYLDPQEVEALRSTYWSLGPAPDDPRVSIFFDYQSRTSDYKRSVTEAVTPTLAARSGSILDRWHLFYPNFIMKWPGNKSSFGPHLDSSFVDEQLSHSISIWCPLDDTSGEADTDNGLLRVVPGSHRFVESIRAHRPWGFPYAGSEPAIVEELGVPLRVRAGEAVVFDHRLLHYSMDNVSAEPRLVIAAGYQPENSQLYHFRQVTEDGFDMYAIDDEYFIETNPFSLAEVPPRGYELTEHRIQSQPLLTTEELRSLCATVDSACASDHGWFAEGRRPKLVERTHFCFKCGRELPRSAGATAYGNQTDLCGSCADVHNHLGPEVNR